MEFQLLLKSKMLEIMTAFNISDDVFIMLINVKMPIIVGILTFMSMINVMLSLVEHEKTFYNLEARSGLNQPAQLEQLHVAKILKSGHVASRHARIKKKERKALIMG